MSAILITEKVSKSFIVGAFVYVYIRCAHNIFHFVFFVIQSIHCMCINLKIFPNDLQDNISHGVMWENFLMNCGLNQRSHEFKMLIRTGIPDNHREQVWSRCVVRKRVMGWCGVITSGYVSSWCFLLL